MKRIILFLVLLSSVGASRVSVAEEPCPQPVPLAEARTLLSKVQVSYNGVRSIKAQFEQYSELAALDQSEKSSGSVVFKKPGFMRWDYKQPEEQVFLIRENTLWLYQVAQQQVLVDAFQKVLISDLPVAFLMGLGDLARDFEIQSACRGQSTVSFALVPSRKSEQERAQLQSFDLLVSTASNLPIGATVVDIGGNTTRIELKGLDVNNSKISDTLFEAAFPAGVDIIDRRTGEAG